MAERKTSRRRLVTNKPAMLALKHMVKSGLSTKEIRKEFVRIYGASAWSESCINRAKIALTQGPPKPKTPVLTSVGGKDPDDLTFGELCEYTASFFEPIARAPKGQDADQKYWDAVRDKISHWECVRGRTAMPLMDLNKSQLRAYDFCNIMCRENAPTGKKYGLYREWRDHSVAACK